MLPRPHVLFCRRAARARSASSRIGYAVCVYMRHAEPNCIYVVRGSKSAKASWYVEVWFYTYLNVARFPRRIAISDFVLAVRLGMTLSAKGSNHVTLSFVEGGPQYK